jgi:dipeptidase D
MMDVHTVKERVSKQSIDNVWKLLKEIVEAY